MSIMSSSSYRSDIGIGTHIASVVCLLSSQYIFFSVEYLSVYIIEGTFLPLAVCYLLYLYTQNSSQCDI